MSLPATQKAVYIEGTSDSVEGILYGDVPTPQISGADDVIIRNKYTGVNFIESYFRKGIYPVTQFPYVFGREASGEVAAVGENVTNFAVGDKVAYLSPATFAQYTKIQLSAVAVKKLPADTSDTDLKQWSAVLLQGLTAITFAHEAYPVKQGDFILVWAAAGGVGQILTQYTASIGARVIAVASSDEKLAIAKKLGAEFLVKLSDDVVARVTEITGGAGVAASFDSIGKDTFEASFAAVGRKGTIVSFGNASGTVPPVAINRLSAKNIKLCRPQVLGYVATPEEWEKYTDILLKKLDDKLVQLTYTEYPLSEYKGATEALESRKTTGKLVLAIP